MFLGVILTIWLLAMVQELREIVVWLQVLIFFPTDPGDQPVAEYKDDRIVVNAVPSSHKCMTVVLNVLPRSMICANLILVGSQFLIRADDYSDLILNSVALGFLIEIDNMMFQAIMSEDEKRILNLCDPFVIPAFNPDSALQSCLEKVGIGTTVIYSTVVVSSVLMFIVTAYCESGGKYDAGRALNCFCHFQGISCVNSRILGGNALPLRWNPH